VGEGSDGQRRPRWRYRFGVTSTLLATGTSGFHLDLVGSGKHTLGLYGIVSDITFHPVPLVILAAATYWYLRSVRKVNAGAAGDRPIVFGGPGVSGATTPLPPRSGGHSPLSNAPGLPGITGVVADPITRALTSGGRADRDEADSDEAETLGTIVDRGGFLRRRAWAGEQIWPRWRTWSFLAAIAALAAATLSGLTSFERSSFAIVGTQHSLIVFVAPFFLAFAAPVTLTMAVSPPARAERIRAAFTGRTARVLSYPLVAAVIFGGWLFLIYFTPIFRVALDHAALWQLIDLSLLVTGCLFAWPMAAVDPVPKPTGHGWRMLWLLLTLPYTTILGMSLESEHRGIAPGVTPAELHTGGGIIWTVGGFLGLFATILVLAQWCRLEERSATRRDRVLDPEAAAQLAYWKANRRIAAEESGLIRNAVPEELAAEVRALAARDEPLALGTATARALGRGDMQTVARGRTQTVELGDTETPSSDGPPGAAGD
jgi:putative membrane protein